MGFSELLLHRFQWPYQRALIDHIESALLVD